MDTFWEDLTLEIFCTDSKNIRLILVICSCEMVQLGKEG